MAGTPRINAFDSSLALLREGYPFGQRRFERLDADLFETRLLLRKAVVLRGAEAARLFYDPALFVRHGAMPGFVLKTLLGKDGVQTLDGDAHRRRKALFMGLMTPASQDEVAARALGHWRDRAAGWSGRGIFSLLDEAYLVFTRAAFDWAGLPLSETEAPARARELTLLIESAAWPGPKHVRGRLARRRCERWAGAAIGNARSAALDLRSGCPVRAVAEFQDENGAVLDERVAAVELLNLLRPIAAVALFLSHAVVEMAKAPEIRARLADDGSYRHGFVQEVRRCYSFFPMVAAIARKRFSWRGHVFAEGRWVMLDLFASNRHPAVWDEPERFRPERFLNREVDAYQLIPQGGGDHHRHHRCPGEWLTIALLDASLAFLAGETVFSPVAGVPTISFRRMPMLPSGRLRVQDARLLQSAGTRPPA